MKKSLAKAIYYTIETAILLIVVFAILCVAGMACAAVYVKIASLRHADPSQLKALCVIIGAILTISTGCFALDRLHTWAKKNKD